MATLIDQEFFARLQALNDKFAASVPATLARIQAARDLMDAQQPDGAVVKELHQILHTVAGSAATFGFRTLGLQARQLEQRLRVMMAFDAVAAEDWSDWLGALDNYLAWARIDPKAQAYIDDNA